MKKTVFTLLFLLIVAFVQTQSFGASGLSVRGNFSNAKDYQKWFRIGNTNDATMKFEQTEKGIDEAVATIQRMLVENNLDVGRPDVYKSVKVEGTGSDTARLNRLIMSGDARVNLAWFAPDGSTLQLFLDKNSYEVNVMNAFKM